MPIYEFECEECGSRFEELVAAERCGAACPQCGSRAGRGACSRRVAPPGRQPRGAEVRSDESRRGEREAATRSGSPRDRAKRAQGEQP